MESKACGLVLKSLLSPVPYVVVSDTNIDMKVDEEVDAIIDRTAQATRSGHRQHQQATTMTDTPHPL